MTYINYCVLAQAQLMIFLNNEDSQEK